METILIIEDVESLGRVLSQALTRAGFEVRLAKDGEAGIAMVREGGVDLVVTDLKLPGQSGLDVLQTVKAQSAEIPVILMTAHGNIELAVRAVKEGAYDFIAKPFDPDHLLLQIEKALEKKRLLLENRILKENLKGRSDFPNIIGTSQGMIDATENIKKVAKGKTTVLLLGESGTGKDLFARVLHMLSPRRDQPFVSINCAAIPKDLMESELFGHERGAFTGAVSQRHGNFELAHKGTLFLDEIGEMDLALQPKLLRILEAEEMMRVGGTHKIKLDVRLVAATNRNLLQQVRQERFREDLYYRLNVFSVMIPPLRERRGDIPLLVNHFIAHYSRELKKTVKGITPAAMEQIQRHPFRGNVRELQNCIERAIILCDGEWLLPEDFGLAAHNDLPLEDNRTAVGGNSFGEERGEGGGEGGGGEGLQSVGNAAARLAESQMIKKTLAETGGNKWKAAKQLQVSYKTLLTKIKEYGIDRRSHPP